MGNEWAAHDQAGGGRAAWEDLVHSPTHPPDATTHGQAGFSGSIKTSCQESEALRPIVMQMKTTTAREEAWLYVYFQVPIYRYKKASREKKIHQYMNIAFVQSHLEDRVEGKTQFQRYRGQTSASVHFNNSSYHTSCHT